jgi:hypothetical protein
MTNNNEQRTMNHPEQSQIKPNFTRRSTPVRRSESKDGSEGGQTQPVMGYPAATVRQHGEHE